MRSESRNSSILSLLDEERGESAFQTDDSGLAWKISEIFGVLSDLSSRNVAVLGGAVAVVENGVPIPLLVGWPAFSSVWDTEPRRLSESWDSYCERTIAESRSKLDEFLKLKELEEPQVLAMTYIRPDLAFPNDPRLFVPRSKHDHERAAAAIAAGYPAVEPVLPELLEWLQDMNWPVAQTLEPFIASIGMPLAPFLTEILNSDDDVWKYWIINRVIADSFDLVKELSEHLRRIAYQPTSGEKEEGVDIDAREVLERHGFGN